MAFIILETQRFTRYFFYSVVDPDEFELTFPIQNRIRTFRYIKNLKSVQFRQILLTKFVEKKNCGDDTFIPHLKVLLWPYFLLVIFYFSSLRSDQA
jgi:hypothetical protein